MRWLAVFVFGAMVGCAASDGASSKEKEQAQPYVSLETRPSTATIAVGKSVTFTLHQRTSNGELAPLQGTAAWESNDDRIATIDAKGVATGRAVGKVMITGSWGPGASR